MIPKILFTYWEGDQLSELHYYTIYSLHKHNPELDITIYTALNTTTIFKQWKTSEHSVEINKKILLDEIVSINRKKIKLVPIDFQNEYNIENNISCVYKADFTRIVKLYEHGGVWFDMDILFIKPLPEFLFSTDVDMFLFTYQGSIPTGFIAGIPKCAMITDLYKTSVNIIKNKQLDNYQKIGPELWRTKYNIAYKKNIFFLNTEHIYPFIWNTIDVFFTSTDESGFKDYTFGVHWYNGGVSTKKFINTFDRTSVNAERSLFEKMIKRIM
jgi:mannosyltransferase OCH1-like enzyme